MFVHIPQFDKKITTPDNRRDDHVNRQDQTAGYDSEHDGVNAVDRHNRKDQDHQRDQFMDHENDTITIDIHALIRMLEQFNRDLRDQTAESPNQTETETQSQSAQPAAAPVSQTSRAASAYQSAQAKVEPSRNVDSVNPQEYSNSSGENETARLLIRDLQYLLNHGWDALTIPGDGANLLENLKSAIFSAKASL